MPNKNSAPTVDWNDFALGHSTKAKGNSYTTLPNGKVVDLVRENWAKAMPGDGETTRDRKVLVPVPPEGFFCPPTANLVEGLPVRAEVTRRQEGEELHVETFVTPQDAAKFGALVEVPAAFVEVVCYSRAALAENNEETTSAEWEIICLLCTTGDKTEPMRPLTMARNMLEKPGGTAGQYTGQEFAEAVWHWSTQKGVKVRPATV
jgi:hypothetical protein